MKIENKQKYYRATFFSIKIFSFLNHSIFVILFLEFFFNMYNLKSISKSSHAENIHEHQRLNEITIPHETQKMRV